MRLATSLLVVVLVSGLLVLAVSATVISIQHQQTARKSLRESADTIERVFETQLVGFETGIALQPRFPDWDATARITRSAGTCIALIRPDGTSWRRECRGTGDFDVAVPALFSDFYRLAANPDWSAERTVNAAGEVMAYLELTQSDKVQIAQAWEKITQVTTPLTVAVGSLCLIVFFGINIVVRPGQRIAAALDRIADAGEHPRLGHFRIEEFEQIAVAVSRLCKRLEESETRRRTAALTLMHAQANERIRIARDIHDEFGQHLTGIAGSAAALKSKVPITDRGTLNDVDRIEASARALLTQLRSILSQLRPSDGESFDVAEKLQKLVSSWRDRSGEIPEIRLTIDQRADLLRADLAFEIYRIVQECLTNAVRHANARHIDVSISFLVDNILIRVTDDGIGIDLLPDTPPGAGLIGMKERIAALGGKLCVYQNSDVGGTTIAAEFAHEFA